MLKVTVPPADEGLTSQQVARKCQEHQALLNGYYFIQTLVKLWETLGWFCFLG